MKKKKLEVLFRQRGTCDVLLGHLREREGGGV